MKEFLKYIKKESLINLDFIQKIKLNKKSISIQIDKDIYPFVFNSMFTEKNLLKIIIKYLSQYLNKDYDYLAYKYKKINIRCI